MKMGRPTLYTPELLEKAWAYAKDGWREAGDQIPSLVGLALEIGITRQTCENWKKDPEKPEFFGICDHIQQAQHRELLNNGLTGDFAAPITKMILTKHGYSDKVDNISSDGTMTPTAFNFVPVAPADGPDDNGDN